MKKSFDDFLNQLSETNSTLEFFVDFEKVTKKISKISIKLNQLNYLIGKENLKEAIHELYKENKDCFKVLNIIIAVRDNRAVLNSQGEIVKLNSFFKNPESIYEFIVNTGLDKVLLNKEIKNLVDYVFGIEVGLDTNARKNRGGKSMENAIENIFIRNDIPYQKEVRHTHFEELKDFSTDVKKYDFVVNTKKKIYLIETNFYNSSGSKLNEVARSYKDLALRIKKLENFDFVWITDGKGWLSAKRQLENTFNKMEHIYNLKSFSMFIEHVKNETNN